MVVWQFALTGWMHAADGVVYQGKAGPGQGKHIVFLAGDEEYRSEEGLPMLAKTRWGSEDQATGSRPRRWARP